MQAQPYGHHRRTSRRPRSAAASSGSCRSRLARGSSSTWYGHDGARSRWQVISDALIHRIHARVLDHIKNEVERDRRDRRRT
jgi:hypothetical protein